jgi:hypothetical protein
MKLAVVVALLACQSYGQSCIEIHYSRQADEVVKELLGVVPKTVSVYRADVVNTCQNETRFFPSRVGFEAAGSGAPMQDPEATLFAAQHFKDTRWWVVSLGILRDTAKYAGPAALGLSTAGIAVPAIVTGLAGGIGGGTAIIEGYRQKAAELKVPATWLRDGLPEIILKPGEPVSYLLALGGKPDTTFKVSVASLFPPVTRISAIEPTAANIPVISATHPMVDEPVIYDIARIAAMIMERSRAIGAVE